MIEEAKSDEKKKALKDMKGDASNLDVKAKNKKRETKGK